MYGSVVHSDHHPYHCQTAEDCQIRVGIEITQQERTRAIRIKWKTPMTIGRHEKSLGM